MRRGQGRLGDLMRRVFPWPLLPLRLPWLATLVSVLVLVGLLLSRVLLLPKGPWEQDEALLACGVVNFDPTHHMPIPPGFPLWVYIGRLVMLLGVHNPLTALQLASAGFSVIGAWALVGLFAEVTGPAVARAGALLAAFLPGVWFHAHRGFSGTPSAALAVIGLACWVRGGRNGFLPGVGLMTAAALVRPPLAPAFVVAVLLASWSVRRERGRLIRAAALAGALVMVVCVPAALEAGGPRAMLNATEAHADEHFALLGMEGWSWSGSGYARGLGAPAAATLFLALATLGWLTRRRSLRRGWWEGNVFGLALLATVVLIHNHTYPRYYVLVWMLMAVPAVAGVRLIVRHEAVAILLAVAAAAAGAAWVYPAMWEIHERPLPAVAMLERAEEEGHGQTPVLIFQDELFSFRNLADRQGWLRMPSMRMEEVGHPRLDVAGQPVFLLTETLGQAAESVDSEVTEARVASPVVTQLSQGRFLSAALIRNPVIVWRGAGSPEWEDGHRYFWFGRSGSLLVPPVSERGQVSFGIEVLEALGDVTMTVKAAGCETFHRVVHPGKQVITVPLPSRGETFRLDQLWPLEIDVERDAVLPGDVRALAFRLFTVSVEAPPNSPGYYEFTPGANAMPMTAVRGEGFYGVEPLGGDAHPAAWTGAQARIDMPVGRGEVGLELLAPRRGTDVIEVRLGDASAHVEVGPPIVWLVLPVPNGVVAAGRGTLEISSTTYNPGPQDPRDLGVAVRRVWYRPARR